MADAVENALSRLNQRLSSIGRATSLSWQESTSGLAFEPKWTCICKIDGIPRGQGSATRKHFAKLMAADGVLKYLDDLTAAAPPATVETYEAIPTVGKAESSTGVQDGMNAATSDISLLSDKGSSLGADGAT
ncbi:hypothetical protein BKA70DRAFT_307485 [Coprinopsis sp. MPI-PUGE-AT-0042]|nr:hypothetical protein BKA70DRAFT_307485 [Coprinopsis sp. MPI-PUGE-AT-0042]